MIPFLDLHKINARFYEVFQTEFKTVLNTSRFILGDKVEQFEADFSKYCGTQYCISTGNGLDALTLILKAQIALGKLQEGDKIMLPATTFVATALSVIHAGLSPVFAEPEHTTYNVSLETIKAAYTKDIKAIIIVHLYGQLVETKSLNEFCEANNLLLIEDAAQAHGAENEDKIKAGNLGDAAAFSFYPSKNLGALGDGGAITTNNQDLYKQLIKLRNYGSVIKYKNEILGYNTRLDELQAAFLSVKLKHLDDDNEKRRQIAGRYITEINNSKIELPYYNGSKNHVFYAFVVQVEYRDDFVTYLSRHEIGHLIHYPIPPHKQEALKEFNEIVLPITEQIHKTVVSLPMSPVMTDEEVNEVIKILNQY